MANASYSSHNFSVSPLTAKQNSTAWSFAPRMDPLLIL